MEQETKNIICLLLNVLILPGLGTIIHGEIKRGLIQIAILIVSIPILFGLGLLTAFLGGESWALFAFGILFWLGLLTAFLVVWIWALLDGVAFLQNKEFYVFKNLK